MSLEPVEGRSCEPLVPRAYRPLTLEETGTDTYENTPGGRSLLAKHGSADGGADPELGFGVVSGRL
jgi:hypothetical protein